MKTTAAIIKERRETERKEKEIILKEIENKYNISINLNNNFENSCFYFYRNRKFLTKKQITAIKNRFPSYEWTPKNYSESFMEYDSDFRSAYDL
jgi:hypothetical protein